MPFALEVQQKPGYLHIRVTGENTPEVVRGYLEAVLRVAAEHRCSAVLVEEDLSGPALSLIDVFDLAREGARTALGAMRRVAYVDVNREHPHENMQFAETVVVNRGLNARVFTTVEEAERWIAG